MPIRASLLDIDFSLPASFYASICIVMLTFLSFQMQSEAQQTPSMPTTGVPLWKVKKPKAGSVAAQLDLTAAKAGQLSPIAALAVLQCSSIPTSPTASFNKYYYLTTDVAGQLGINWIGTVNATAEAQQVVLIREYRRYAQCPTTDGSGQLQYGAALRATVLVSADSLQAGLNFAVVAASATLKNQSASVLIEDIGFNDPKLDPLAQQAMQDVAGTGLTVSNFGVFNKDLEAAIGEAGAAPNTQIITPYQQLAFVPNGDSTQFSNSVATTFGLSCMAKGWGCADAQNQFPGRDANSDAAIQQLYTTLTNSCTGVNGVQQANAQSLLSGVATTPTCHN
jgi:hypothetical protein